MKYLLLLLFILCLGCSKELEEAGIGRIYIKEIDLSTILYFDFSDTIPVILKDDTLRMTELGIQIKNTVEPCASIAIKPNDEIIDLKLSCIATLKQGRVVPKLMQINFKSTCYDKDCDVNGFVKSMEDYLEIHSASFLNYKSGIFSFKNGIDTLHFIK